eukprot:TRINITY_DN9895_c0_g1_i1.p1 TRINITY_DN9895_c0_g1~~TRINITY_DN9895_c0_g1_i1.p1  ORF type:complete len:230 (-),score=35.19 TRINITY_DN9895_c0_g1_i1:149-838(-)
MQTKVASANLTVDLWKYNEPGTLSFGAQKIQMNPQTLKMTVTISNWAFRSVNNRLGLIFLSASTKRVGECDYSGYQQSEELKWVQVNAGSFSLYTELENYAIIDGKNRTVSFQWLGDGKILASFQHFWTEATIDPSYQLLVSESETSSSGDALTTPHNNVSVCGRPPHLPPPPPGNSALTPDFPSKKQTTTMIVIVVVVVGCAIISLATIATIFSLRKKGYFSRRLQLK